MNFKFISMITAKYVIASAPPSEDYPPSNVATMIKQCEVLGRKDLAEQIKMQWRNVINKYPQTRLNWAAATTIGFNSIKKNIFKGKDFVIWLKEQEELTSKQEEKAQNVSSIVSLPENTPSIAIPKKNETPEQWSEAAAKTKAIYIEAKKAFGDVKEYIAYLEKEADALKKKIVNYGEGGEKEKTKSGEPSKYAARVPKWEELLKVAVDMIADTKKDLKDTEKEFKTAIKEYEHAPITTVAYEEKAQDSLDNVLEHILNMSDLKKQRELLQKLDSIMKNKAVACVYEATAAGDNILALLQRVRNGFKTLMTWLKGLRSSVKSFAKLAAIRY